MAHAFSKTLRCLPAAILEVWQEQEGYEHTRYEAAYV